MTFQLKPFALASVLPGSALAAPAFAQDASTPAYTGTGISAADLNAERAKLHSQVDKYQTYPVLQASVAYRF
jgi:hypothetical protein